MLTRDKKLFKLAKGYNPSTSPTLILGFLSENVIFSYIYSSCFWFHLIPEMQLSFLNVFLKKRRRRKENIKDISSRKPQKALKTIWDSDAAEASLRLLFSTFSGQSLSHPIWINRWASRSSSTFLSNEISLKITHCRSDIRALVFHGWTPKSHPLLYILMFSNHII